MGCFMLFLTGAGAVVERATAAEVFGEGCQLALVGKLEAGDGAVFSQRVIERLDEKCDVIKLYLYSPGGNLRAALDIGRQVHMLQMITVGPELYLQSVKDKPLPRNGRRIAGRARTV